MAAAMMMQMPRDMAPTRMASAMLCSWTISFQRWYGVSLSITTNAMMKMSMPIRANTSAAMMLPSGTRFILFASGVMVIEAVDGTIRAGIVANRLGDIFQLSDTVQTPAVILRETGSSKNEQSVSEIKFSEHRLLLRISDFDRRMIALGPAHAFESDRAPRDRDRRQKQREKGDAEKPKDRNISFHFYRVCDWRMLGIDFRLDAQIIMTGWNAGENDAVFLTALSPGTIAVVAVVVADLAAEVPSLLGIIVNQRVVQIDPGIIDIGGGGDFHVRCAAFQIENVGDKRRLALGFANVQLVTRFERGALGRCQVKSGHKYKQKNGKRKERAPNAFHVFADRRRLIFVNAHGFRRFPRKVERLPDVRAVGVLAERPRDFVGGFFRSQDARRLDVLRYGRVFADADLPGKFTENEIGVGVGSLEMLVGLAEIIRRGKARLRKLFANADVVPVAVVFGQVANGFIGIEEHIFVPTVSDALDSDAAPLESDDFIIHAAKLATRSERNERPRFSGSCFKLLQDLKIWIFGVQNGMATLANDGFGVTQCAKNDRRAALRTVQSLDLRLRRRIRKRRSACAHHQPSNLRRFLSLRSSNSTNS